MKEECKVMDSGQQDIRSEWRSVVRSYLYNFEEPASTTVWSPGLETVSRDKLREIQSTKLRVAYRYLWECSPFYRNKFQNAGLGLQSVQGVDDLHKIPLTFREEWVKDQAENPPWGSFSPLQHAEWTERGWMLFTTSGTIAAQPRVFRHTNFDKDLWSWLGSRALYAMGVRKGDVAINCFGYGTSVAFWGLHYALNHMGVPVIPGGAANSERRALFINNYKPTVLLCTPSYALYLGRVMQEQGYPPQNSSIRIIVTAGEPGACIPSMKQRVEELWNATMHDDFGCTEVAMSPLGYTCAEQATSRSRAVDAHLMEDVYIPEAIDPVTHLPVKEGEPGILVVSNLFSESQPILRYAMGDWITITTKPCECGRTHARAVGGLKGRNDKLIKIKGLMFFPAAIEDSIRSLPECGDEFRFEIRDESNLDQIKVTIEPSSHMPKDTLSSAERSIARSLRGKLGITVDVEVVARGSLPRTAAKADRIFDLRQREATS